MARPNGSGPGAPLPPTLIYVVGFLLGWWFERVVPLASGELPGAAARIVGWIAVAVGSGLFAWGLATFAQQRTGIMLQQAATRVVSVGPYRWSRNPQYVAFTLIYLGLSLAYGLIWPVILLPAVILVLTAAVIAREERYMRATFGPGYADYCQRVRRWM